MLLKQIYLIKFLMFNVHAIYWMVYCEDKKQCTRLKLKFDAYHIYDYRSKDNVVLLKRWNGPDQDDREMLVDYRANLVDIIDLIEEHFPQAIIRLNFTVHRESVSKQLPRIQKYYIDKWSNGPMILPGLDDQTTRIVKTM